MNNTKYDAPIQGVTVNTLIEALGGRRSGTNVLCHCPIHPDKTASLSLKIIDGKLARWRCFAGCDGGDLMRAFKQIVGGQLQTVRDLVPEQPDEWAANEIRKVWREAQTVQSGDPVHTYLTVTRRLPLSVIPRDIKIAVRHELRHDKQSLGYHPVMLAAIRNKSGDLVQVHRTYLTPDGHKLKAIEDWNGRKLMKSPFPGCWKGGAIRLGDPLDSLVIGEGIESTLAASILSGFPGWACVSANGLETVEVPDTVTTVHIAHDSNDVKQIGKQAALKLARRLVDVGKNVFLVPAPGLRKGSDWADLVGVA